MDNSVYSFAFQIDNGVPIIPFYEDKNDDELFHLITYFDCIRDREDVREYNRDAFHLEELAIRDTDDSGEVIREEEEEESS